VNKGEKSTMNTIYSSIAYISTKSIKIKLDKEKAAMLWKKISEILSEKNWTVYKLCLKAGIGPAGIYRLRDGEVKDLYFDTVKKIADALEISIDELR
jgi:DNA-binding Xre family transcriptional regulator